MTISCLLITGPSPLDKLPPTFLHDVEAAGDRLVSKAAQLIQNKTTNISENCDKMIFEKMLSHSQGKCWVGLLSSETTLYKEFIHLNICPQ